MVNIGNEKAIAVRWIPERREEASLRENSYQYMSISPLQMLKLAMLQVEMGSNQKTKRHVESQRTQKKLSYTLYMHCSDEMLRVRSLSAATTSDTSDKSHKKTHAI
jgi:hypothetical protein